MKNRLNKEKYLNFKNEHGYMNYEQYIYAIKKICDDIYSKYNTKNIGLIALARGALPMATSISHFTKIREISIMQLQMTNSDNCFDYGHVKLKKYFLYDYDEFVILEDVIYQGNTTDCAINELRKLGKNVAGVYSLAIDEGFSELKENKNIEINYVFDIPKECWLHFLWEEDILNKEKKYE